MGLHTTVEIDDLFGDGGAAMVDLAERWGRYQTYSQEHVDSPIGSSKSNTIFECAPRNA